MNTSEASGLSHRGVKFGKICRQISILYSLPINSPYRAIFYSMAPYTAIPLLHSLTIYLIIRLLSELIHINPYCILGDSLILMKTDWIKNKIVYHTSRKENGMRLKTVAILFCAVLFFIGCAQVQQPKTQPVSSQYQLQSASHWQTIANKRGLYISLTVRNISFDKTDPGYLYLRPENQLLGWQCEIPITEFNVRRIKKPTRRNKHPSKPTLLSLFLKTQLLNRPRGDETFYAGRFLLTWLALFS